MTVHEYFFGIHYRYGREGGDVLQEKLASAGNDLERFEAIPLSREVVETSAGIHAELARLGKQIGINDADIAATRIRYGLTVVTRNKSHFERVPKLKVEGY